VQWVRHCWAHRRHAVIDSIGAADPGLSGHADAIDVRNTPWPTHSLLGDRHRQTPLPDGMARAHQVAAIVEE
jgi:hypothetical protein